MNGKIKTLVGIVLASAIGLSSLGCNGLMDKRKTAWWRGEVPAAQGYKVVMRYLWDQETGEDQCQNMHVYAEGEPCNAYVEANGADFDIFRISYFRTPDGSPAQSDTCNAVKKLSAETLKQMMMQAADSVVAEYNAKANYR